MQNTNRNTRSFNPSEDIGGYSSPKFFVSLNYFTILCNDVMLSLSIVISGTWAAMFTAETISDLVCDSHAIFSRSERNMLKVQSSGNMFTFEIWFIWSGKTWLVVWSTCTPAKLVGLYSGFLGPIFVTVRLHISEKCSFPQIMNHRHNFLLTQPVDHFHSNYTKVISCIF